MSIARQKFREIIFLILYCRDQNNNLDAHTQKLLMEQLAVTKKNIQNANVYAERIQKHFTEIDQMISDTAFSYEFERIQLVERNILRLGIFELFYDKSNPPKVVISEALRLAKKFGTPSAAAFVNAILDALFKKTLGEKTDDEAFNNTLKELKKSEEISKNIIQSME